MELRSARRAQFILHLCLLNQMVDVTEAFTLCPVQVAARALLPVGEKRSRSERSGLICCISRISLKVKAFLKTLHHLLLFLSKPMQRRPIFLHWLNLEQS